MEKNELLIRLKTIIEEYINDNSDELMNDIAPNRVKYILGELEQRKVKEYSPEVKRIIKDIYFHFC